MASTALGVGKCLIAAGALSFELDDDGADAKGAFAGALQNNGADGLIRSQRFEGVAERCPASDVERIQLFGPIERHAHDAVGGCALSSDHSPAS